MKEEYVRAYPSNKIVGIIRYLDNGDQAAVDFPSRMILGYYRAKYNHTTKFSGYVIGNGNQLMSMFNYNK